MYQEIRLLFWLYDGGVITEKQLSDTLLDMVLVIGYARDRGLKKSSPIIKEYMLIVNGV
jgi:hypothetical protein